MDTDQQEQLRRLDAKIAAAKGSLEPEPRADEHYSQASEAWRMVIELVAGIAIGFGIGYGLDALFGTLPIFMVLFVLLGFAAGIKTMMRTAAEIQEKRLAEGSAETERPTRSTESEGA